ncbi:chemotaxis protein CheW [Skermanella stibiiresistens SB22]|uniref:Chemotaxis protein CheW n=2 Tax=Skermanella TaxID=204447 RepID=W9H6J0_9PROT|nr:chemotaxis protein CheW [Skermanella stibiiresistens SB22]
MADRDQYVTLGLDREVFAVPVGKVREILDVRAISSLPHAPAYLLGIIDVRGRSIPVIDLRVKLGMPAVPATPDSRIIVTELAAAGRVLVLGLLADRVFEVTAMDGDRMDPPPDIGARWEARCVVGVGRRGDGFVIVFDLEKLFADEDPLASGVAA